MEVSQEFFSIISSEEGEKSCQYPDGNGHPTIGIGHKLDMMELSTGIIMINNVKVYYQNGLSQQQIYDLLRQDVKNTVDFVNKAVIVSLSQNQFDSLISFVYNIGVTNFYHSTLLQELNNKNYNDVPNQMARWNKENGVVTTGLINRRNKEIALWLKH